jgi:hypothetical protein
VLLLLQLLLLLLIALPRTHQINYCLHLLLPHPFAVRLLQQQRRQWAATQDLLALLLLLQQLLPERFELCDG